MDDPDLALKTGTLQDPETEITAKSDTPYSSAHSFEELGLSPELLQGLYTEMKFEKPSKIQAKTLPMILTPPFKSMIAQVRWGVWWGLGVVDGDGVCWWCLLVVYYCVMVIVRGVRQGAKGVYEHYPPIAIIITHNNVFITYYNRRIMVVVRPHALLCPC